MKIEIEGLKRGYKQSMGYPIGAGIAAIIVLSANWNLKTFILLLIIHPIVWSLLAFLTYKIDEKRRKKRR